MNDVLELLLNLDPPELPCKQVRLKRLSELCGRDVVFELKALPFSRVAEIKKTHAGDEEMGLHILLGGVTSPNLKDKRLAEKYHAHTPAELLKKLLLPGEIEDLSREIELLSGYRTLTLEDVKKK